MIVIADTTPIITLIKLNRLDLLEKIFGTIFIPSAVYEELTANQNFLAEANLVNNSLFLKRCKVSDRQSIKILREIVGLDAGESEAIALAEEKSADLIIIDEHKGRQVAKKIGIKITGTIGLLIHAFDEKFLSRKEILACIEILQASNIRISDALFTTIFEHVNLKQR